jgi:hypothetical protein
MKNMIKFFGVIALVAVIGFLVAGCKEPETDPTPQTVTYKGTADSKTYVLTINETDGTYELTVGGKTSKGSATKSGSTWTLTPTGGDAFTVTVSSLGITDMKGEITFTDGSKENAPTTVTPIPPSSSTMTVSNIPSQYVGGSNRLYLSGLAEGGGDGSGRVWSGTSQGNTTTTTPISGTTVALPLNWRSGTTGNERLVVYIFITSDTSINLNGSGIPTNITAGKYMTLTFSNGNASVEWNKLTDWP